MNDKLKKAAELLKAKIYNLGFDPAKPKGTVLADLPHEPTGKVTNPPGLMGHKGGGQNMYAPTEAHYKEHMSQLHERIKERFGDETKTHKYIDSLKNHDEPYAGGDFSNVAWRTKEKDKGRWNDPMPFPAHVKDLKGVMGKRVPQGGPDPLPWVDKKYESSRTLLAMHHDKPLTIHTRSDLIAHDDYMQHLNKEKHEINIHTFSDNGHINRLIEPGAASHERRLQAAEKLAHAGYKVNIVHDQIEHPDLNPDIKAHNALLPETHARLKNAGIGLKENKVQLTQKGLDRLHRSLGMPKTKMTKSGESFNDLKKAEELEKAKIINLGHDPKKPQGAVLHDEPSAETPRALASVIRDGKKEVVTREYVKENYNPDIMPEPKEPMKKGQSYNSLKKEELEKAPKKPESSEAIAARFKQSREKSAIKEGKKTVISPEQRAKWDATTRASHDPWSRKPISNEQGVTRRVGQGARFYKGMSYKQVAELEKGDVIQGKFGTKKPATPPEKTPEHGQSAGKFKVGDMVQHPVHGMARIEGYEEREFAPGKKQAFYNMTIGSHRIFMPAENAHTLKVPSKADADKLITHLKTPHNSPIDHQTWNRRYRNHMESMSSGDIHRVADVYKELKQLHQEKDLSFGERKLAEQAHRHISDYIQAATGKAWEDK
jgi:CarD family transcriptional regulator